MAKNKRPIDLTEELDLIAEKDWHILAGSWDKLTDRMQYDIKITKGERFKIPRLFLANLVTEGVVNPK
jgi:hypothetical protein